MIHFGFALEMPRLRSGVLVEPHRHGATITQRAWEWNLTCEEEVAPAVHALLNGLLGGGMSRPELGAASGIDVAAVDAVIEELDRLGLLTEKTRSIEPGTVTGQQAARELRRFVDRSTRTIGTSRMYARLVEGSATVGHVIGFAVEYYHVVKAFPIMVAPALARADLGDVTTLIQDYYVSELKHDRLLAQALSAVGIPEVNLSAISPLSSTFAIIASLSAYARQDWLTFCAALWLFEEPSPAFTDAFVASVTKLGLPAGLARPILAHAETNEFERHNDMPELLITAQGAVSLESRLRAKKRLYNLIEMLVWMEDQILAAGAEDATLEAAVARFLSPPLVGSWSAPIRAGALRPMRELR